jgi:hypothetical protein
MPSDQTFPITVFGCKLVSSVRKPSALISRSCSIPGSVENVAFVRVRSGSWPPGVAYIGPTLSTLVTLIAFEEWRGIPKCCTTSRRARFLVSVYWISEQAASFPDSIWSTECDIATKCGDREGLGFQYHFPKSLQHLPRLVHNNEIPHSPTTSYANDYPRRSMIARPQCTQVLACHRAQFCSLETLSETGGSVSPLNAQFRTSWGTR